MESELERLIAKQTKVRDEISKVLLKNFPLEKELADFLAMDVTTQAIGEEAIERYNGKKELERKKAEAERIAREKQEWWDDKKEDLKHYTGITFKGILPSILGIALIGFIIFNVHGCMTALPYPRTYSVIPEHARFVDTERSSWKGDVVVGLHDESNLCVRAHGVRDRYGMIGGAKTCIHRNRLDSLNQALDNAVKNDINGVIWNEPNGNGEVWEVHRNNYRFVITAKHDENFME
jgi:hypothetical protein